MYYLFLPPANEVCEGYVFTPVCHSVQHALQVVSQHALQQVSRGVSRPLRGIWLGAVPAPGGCLLWGCVESPPPMTVTAARNHINEKHHGTWQFALKLIPFSTVTNLFPLEFVQKLPNCQLCVLRENSIEGQGSFTLLDDNGNGKFIFFPSWMDLMESNRGVHTGGRQWQRCRQGVGWVPILQRQWQLKRMGLMQLNGSVHTEGRWQWQPICTWMFLAVAAPSPSVWTLMTENKFSVAVVVTQYERTFTSQHATSYLFYIPSEEGQKPKRKSMFYVPQNKVWPGHLWPYENQNNFEPFWGWKKTPEGKTTRHWLWKVKDIPHAAWSCSQDFIVVRGDLLS